MALAEPVRRLLGSPSAEVVAWESRPLTAGSADPQTGGIYHVGGTAVEGQRTMPWSLVLKILRANGRQAADGDAAAWQREAAVYRSGVLDLQGGGLGAPCCYGVVQRSAREIWLWLEEIADTSPRQWAQAHYGLVAHQLGRFNGAYLAGRPIPSLPWLRTPWLRSYVERSGPGIAHLAAVAEHPLVQRAFPGATVTGLLRLWAERAQVFAALDGLPRTFCHRDAWRANVFLRRAGGGDMQAVAIDWGFAGIGLVGEDLGPLVSPSLAMAHSSLQAPDVDRVVFARYLEGLRDAGWRGEPRMVRLAYVATTALRYGPGITGELLRLILDENTHAWAAQAYGWPIAELCDRFGEQLRVSLQYADEARRLLTVLC
jgi:hypothetical protein